MPTYNRPRELACAIRSVLAQTYRDLQVCVYDDGPVSETEKVVRAIAAQDDRVRYLKNAANFGATGTFRRGLEEVSSDFFSFLSDDDALLPGCFARAMEHFRRWPEADAVCGVTWMLDSDGRVASDATEWVPAGYYAAPRGLIETLRHHHREWTGMVFRRNVRAAVGLIDPRTAVPDFDYMLRCAAVCNVGFYDDPVAVFRAHPGSSTFDWGPQFVYPSYAHLAELLEADERIPRGVRLWASKILQRRIDSYLMRRTLKDIGSGNHAQARSLISTLARERRRPLNAWALSLCLAAGGCGMQPVLRMLLKLKRRAARYLRRGWRAFGIEGAETQITCDAATLRECAAALSLEPETTTEFL